VILKLLMSFKIQGFQTTEQQAYSNIGLSAEPGRTNKISPTKPQDLRRGLQKCNSLHNFTQNSDLSFVRVSSHNHLLSTMRLSEAVGNSKR